jgi:hypothetical protein
MMVMPLGFDSGIAEEIVQTQLAGRRRLENLLFFFQLKGRFI